MKEQDGRPLRHQNGLELPDLSDRILGRFLLWSGLRFYEKLLGELDIRRVGRRAGSNDQLLRERPLGSSGAYDFRNTARRYVSAEGRMSELPYRLGLD
ncbi:hypothetical protein [Bradyrhizobium elkanii]|uniref:hypothetical protein n=1 Tax=Bradyrhizobium elkanii TaxID=29448 RepID=UPI00114D2FE4|nr:hypothetical protein [Bradyrhizobium elkanii]